jgi:hypothetical protein
MSIRNAIEEMDAAQSRAHQFDARRKLRIQHVQRLERVVEAVELRNLHRDRQVPETMWRELAELDVTLPVRAPKELWQARNTARLHDALLDWEAELLDKVAPQRREYADTRDD